MFSATWHVIGNIFKDLRYVLDTKLWCPSQGDG